MPRGGRYSCFNLNGIMFSVSRPYGYNPVAAGALILQNEVIPPNSLVAGVPGKVRRTIDRIDSIHAQAIKYKCEWAIGYGVKPDIEGELYHGEKIV